MIEQQLLQYGVLGLWTASLLYEKYKFTQKLINVLDKNNEVIAKNTEMLKRLEKKVK